MPAVAEPPKTTKPDPFAQSAMTGRSPADVAAEGNTPAEPAPDYSKSAPPDFGAALSAAQSKDKGAAPAPAAEKPAPAKADPAPPAEPPRVPSLPSAPAAEEWQPKGQVAKHFEALKTKHAEEMAVLKADFERTKAELAKTNGAPAVEAMKKELAEYKSVLKDVAIERDPEFKQRFSARENAAIEAAKMAAGENAEKIEKLLKLPSSPWRDEQLAKISEDLPVSSQRRLNAALNLLEQVDVERTAEIAQRRATFEQKQAMTAAQQREFEAARRKEMETEFNAVHQEWTDQTKGHPFFTEREGDKEHNATVQQARALSKAIFNGELSPKELATAAHWAATGPLALEGWRAAMKRAEAAEAALDKLRGVSPGEGRSGGPEDEGSAPPPAPGSPEYLRYMNQRLREAQAKDSSARRGVK